MDTTQILLLAVLVFASYTAQAMTGFGSIVVALTLGSLFFEMRVILPVLVALNMPLCAWMLYRDFKSIDNNLLWKRILPLMGLGVVFGVLLFDVFEGPLLRRLFGIIIAAFSLRELAALIFQKNTATKPMHKFISAFWIFIAGLIHGIYASGGPPLVYALSRSALDRAVFRATLTMVWFVLNGALLAVYMINGSFGAKETWVFLYLLPTIPLALKAGAWLHERVSERWFRITLQLLLILSAGALLV
ncbi:MAG: hypothetical protein LDLANPLL_01318 [Turneriella sp.]|nr:hypothetical protein [Turneriella sp.]